MASTINIVLKAFDEYSTVLQGLNTSLELVGKTLKTIGYAADGVLGGLGLVLKGLTSIAGVVLAPVSSAFGVIQTAIDAVYGSIKSLLTNIYDGVQYAAGVAWDAIKSVADFLWTSFKDALSYIWDSVKELGAYAYETMKAWGVQAVESTIKVGNAFEQIRVKMETIWSSGGAAQAALDWATTFGKETPLTLDAVAQSMIKLKSYGFDPMDGSLRKIGDAAFALGTDFDGIVTALGQMKLKGKVTSEELMQLAERNVPAFQYLQKEFKLTADQMGDIGKQGLDVDRAIKSIINGMGNQFSGAMEKASKTAEGMWSNIEDSIMVFQKQLLDAGVWDLYLDKLSDLKDTLGRVFNSSFARNLAPTVKGILNEVFGLFDELTTFVVQNLGNIVKTVSTILGSTAKLWSEIWEVIKKSISELGGSGNVFDFIADSIKTANDYIVKLIKVIPDIIPKIRSIYSETKTKLTEILKYIEPFTKDVPKKIQDSIKTIYATIMQYLPGIKNAFSVFITEVTKGLTYLGNTIFPLLANNGKKFFDALATGIQTVSKLLGKVADVVVEASKHVGKLIDLAFKGVDKVSEGLQSVAKWVPDIIAGITKYYEIVLAVFSGIVNLMNELTANKKTSVSFFQDLFGLAIEGALILGDVLGKVIQVFPKLGSTALKVFESVSDATFVLAKNISSALFKGITAITEMLYKVQENADKIRLAFALTPAGLLSAKAGLTASAADITLDMVKKKVEYDASVKSLENSLVKSFAKPTNFKIAGPDFDALSKTADSILNDFKKLNGVAVDFGKKALSGVDSSLGVVKSSFGEVSGLLNGLKSVPIGVEKDKSWSALDKTFANGGTMRIKIDDGSLEAATKALKGEINIRFPEKTSQSSGVQEPEVLQALVRIITNALANAAYGSSTPWVGVS